MNHTASKLLLLSLVLVVLSGQFLVVALDGGSPDDITDMDMEADPVEEDFDDRTLLDTFGEVAKEYLTQKVIPETDVACRWDWRFVRCEPFCKCEFQPKRGDYHLGRSCRIKEKENCDPVESRPTANPLQLVIQRLVRGSQKTARSVATKTKTGYNNLQSNVCNDLPEINCSDEDGEIPAIAWQERLLCRHMIPACAFEYRAPRNSVPEEASIVEEEVESTPESGSVEEEKEHKGEETA